MENKNRNELEINLGSEKILLRPTFENIAAMEQKVGSVGYLSFKFGKGVTIDSKGKPQVDPEVAALNAPSMSEIAQIIYFNQAEKKYTLEEIFEKVLDDGIKTAFPVMMFLARCTAGNKLAKEPSARQKKR